MKTEKSLHVLVVDDSEPCLRICRIALEQAGYRIRTARSVPDALRALAVEMPDMLVCDLLLGTVGTGFDVVAAARALGGAVFCVAVTGLPTIDIRQNALAAGFDVFLSKPFKPLELIALLSSRSNPG